MKEFIFIENRKIKVVNTNINYEKNDFMMVFLNVIIFDKAFSKTQFYIGSKGKGGIGDRYNRFELFILGGKYYIKDDIFFTCEPANSIEVSAVSVNEIGEVSFEDGRHRYAWLRDFGIREIPVVMQSKSINNAKKFLYI